MSSRKVVGIDLGTTYSAVAHIDAYGKPQIVPNSESERITPSVILFESSSAVVGTVAKNNSVAEPERIVDFVKREMGKPREQFHREIDGRHPDSTVRCKWRQTDTECLRALIYPELFRVFFRVFCVFRGYQT